MHERMRFYRRIIPVLTAVLILSGSLTKPVCLYAANNTIPEVPVGTIDDETEIQNPKPLPEFHTDVTEQNNTGGGRNTGKYNIESAGTAEYASAYSSYDMGYLPDGDPVNQGDSSLCWAFSAAMMAEISLIRKGLTDKLVRFSPDQIGYFFYNRINDPLGNTAEDKNILINGSDYYYNGGNNSFNTWSLASWISVRNEADVPFTGSKYDSLPDNKAYSSSAHLQNAYWASLYTADPRNIDYIENVKELIYDHGSVSAIVSNAMVINENNAVYTPDGGGGHSVTIIGWDDSYPKENFSMTPPGNGAWYVRNSYDGMFNNDSNGCFWLSYYSRDLTDLTTNKAIAYDFESGDNYDNNYQYDGAAGNNYLPLSTDDTQMANVFRAKGDEYLEAVGIAPASPSMSYEINIYKLSANYTSPVGDVSLSRVTGDTRYVGYRTVKLDDPVALSENDIFSVVVDIRDTSGNNNVRYYVDYSSSNGNWLTFQSDISPKQSYNYDTDLYSYGCCARIRAYTDNAGSGPGKPEKKNAALAQYTDGDHSYDGTLHYPTVKVYKGEDGSGELLNEGTDYRVSCYNNKYSGKATVKIFSDSYRIKNDSHTFTIDPKTLDNSITADITPQSFTYDGTEKKPSYTISDNDFHVQLKEGVDYKASYKRNTGAGTAAVVVTGIGDYKGTKTFEFSILPADISSAKVTGIRSLYGYTGAEIRPEPDVTDPFAEDKKLVKGVDYILEYSNNTEEGDAFVIVKGIGNYEGRVEKAFTIIKDGVLQLKVSPVPDQTYIPGGEPVKPEIKVKYEKIVINSGSDYTVSYVNNDRAGEAEAYITGTDNTVYYLSSASTTFTIKSYDLSKALVAGIPDRLYSAGKTYTVSPDVMVKTPVTGKPVTLKEGEDYVLSYKDNTAVKTGQKVTVYIDGINNYTGRIEKTFALRDYVPIGDTEYFDISISENQYEYDGTVKKPRVRVEYREGNAVLSEGTDYKVTYRSNKKAGIAKVIVKPAKSFSRAHNVKGSAEVPFIIKGREAKNLTFAGISDKTYKGKHIRPKVTAYENGKKLSSADYYVEYTDNVNAGKGRFTVYGKRNYSGELGSGTFVIGKQKFSKVKTFYDKGTGMLMVRYGNALLREGIDYKKEESTGLLTSLETNFKAGTKRYS